jgi:hypothetical protein
VFDTGPWNLDPASLADKDIHELNVMVAERSNNEVPAFSRVSNGCQPCLQSRSRHHQGPPAPECC